MKDAVLILGGAFNPVHTQHIEMLCLAKQELETNKQWNIIGGYLAVATDNYVLHKLQKRNERTIKLKHRLALVYEAMKDIPWLINSPYQHEMLQQHDGSAFALSQRLNRLLKKNAIQTFILIGGDRIIKNNIPIWRKPSNKMSNIIRIGIERLMNDNINLVERWKDDMNKNLIPNPEEFILLNLSTRSVSSSNVRLYLSEWFNSKNQSQIENDLVYINNFLHLSVMNYIKYHQDDLYIDI